MSSKWSKIAALTALVGAIAVPGSAQAAKVSATISLASQPGAASTTPAAGGSVSFSVAASGVKVSDLTGLWVANLCYQNGNLVYARYQAVQNPGSNGLAGPFALDWSAGGAAQCHAYVWMFPSSSKPLAGASMDYSVVG